MTARRARGARAVTQRKRCTGCRQLVPVEALSAARGRCRSCNSQYVLMPMVAVKPARVGGWQ